MKTYSHKKRRPLAHIMEDESLNLVREKLPKEWVIHGYKPDYGIDQVVEIFEYINKEESLAETLGESFYVQVKSVKEAKIIKKKVNPRYNVEKEKLKYNKLESLEIEVIRFKIDVNILLTIQAMGSAIPVILFLVCLKTKRLFFVCLNDLIDKVILPDDSLFYNKETKVIYIPANNEINSNLESVGPLKLYAKRPKLYSAFAKFFYQRNELQYCDDFEVIKHFLKIIKRYDFWKTTNMWPAIPLTYFEIDKVDKLLNGEGKQFLEPFIETFKEMKWDDEKISRSLKDAGFILTFFISPLWHKLCNLSNMYEEICREWFLPTYLSKIASDHEV